MSFEFPHKRGCSDCETKKSSPGFSGLLSMLALFGFYDIDKFGSKNYSNQTFPQKLLFQIIRRHFSPISIISSKINFHILLFSLRVFSIRLSFQMQNDRNYLRDKEVHSFYPTSYQVYRDVLSNLYSNPRFTPP